jgi:transposase
MACVLVGCRGGAWLKKGLLKLEVALPVLADSRVVGFGERGGVVMDRVLIGVDPHKESVTIEARDTREILRARGRFETSSVGYRGLMRFATQWPERVWAVEGANGIGRPFALRLVADGERVLDVPAKLAARARVFDTGQGRKTDATDAHAIVLVALRDKSLRELRVDPDLQVLRLLCDRRDELSRAHAQGLNRLHRLFLELLAGGAPVKQSVDQYARLLATVRPRDQVGKTRRRMAAEELADLVRLGAKLKLMKAELRAAVEAIGSHLMDINGIGPAGAARILADVGDVARFPDRNHFASWTGTAPIDASSGEHVRHRLSRAGNRRLNHVLYMAQLVQLRNDTEGRAYYRRKLSQGKTSMEAMRCLRRRLSDVVYRQLVADATARTASATAVSSNAPAKAEPDRADPGGHSGTTLQSSVTDLTPDIGSSDKPLPGPAPVRLPVPRPAENHRDPGPAAHPRRRTGGVNVERPTGRTTLTPTSADAPSKAPRRQPLTT